MNKSEYLRNRIEARSSNDSTAEKYGHNYSGNTLVISDSDVQLECLPICKPCKGKGMVKPMFHTMECQDCFGTGFDLKEPLALIRLQKKYLEQAKSLIVGLRKQLYELGLQDGESEQLAMDKFYRHAKRFD